VAANASEETDHGGWTSASRRTSAGSAS